jgi:hypothetical protein
MTETEIPVLQKNEPLWKYQFRLDKYLIHQKYEKKTKILNFINDWYSCKKNNIQFIDISHFKNQYYNMMPSNDESKKFLIKNFEKYNDEFDLDLDYNEELFTTYNVLYFIELMLKKINGRIIKEVIEEEKYGKIKKSKKYTIKLKK